MRRPRPGGRNERVQIQTAPTYPLPDGQTADLPLRWRRQFSTLGSEQYSAAFHRLTPTLRSTRSFIRTSPVNCTPLDSTLSRFGGDSSSSPPPIEWTDARLAALWTLLSTFHSKRSFGYIRAQAITSSAPLPPSPPSEDPLSPEGGGAEAARAGDVIKINCDAHLALAFKGLLEQFTVAAARAVPARFRVGVGGPPAPLEKSAVESDGADGGGRAGGGAKATMKGKDPQGTSAAADAAEVDDPARDREKWLKGRALVWLDEEGRAVLTA
ncbi:hypothetical protein JCM8202v2_001278 [Rhodotorula sphaerocarpa]